MIFIKTFSSNVYVAKSKTKYIVFSKNVISIDSSILGNDLPLSYVTEIKRFSISSDLVFIECHVRFPGVP